MKKQLIILCVLFMGSLSLKMSWNDIKKIAGQSWGNNFQTNTGSWNGSSGSWNSSSNNGGYTLVQTSSQINGKGAYDLLGLYLKQLIILLSNTDNEIRVVRLEVDSTGENYKVLIRIMDCHGNKTYIGMLVHVCGDEIKIIKFFQSPDPEDIIKALCFLDSTLYNYPDGNIGNNCSNSILSILGEFCSILGGTYNQNNGFNLIGGSNNGGLVPLGTGFNGGNFGGGSFNGGSSIGSDGIKVNIKIPGSSTPNGKPILLGMKKPSL
jgi:hypothetical protein